VEAGVGRFWLFISMETLVALKKPNLKSMAMGEILGRRLSQIEHLFYSIIGVHSLFYNADNHLLSSVEAGSSCACLAPLLSELDKRRKENDFKIIEHLELTDEFQLTIRQYDKLINEYEIPLVIANKMYGTIRLLAKDHESGEESETGPCLHLKYVPSSEIITRTQRLLPILEAFLLMGSRTRELEQTLEGLGALYSAGQMLTSTYNLETVLNQILLMVAETLQVKSCTIRLFNKKTEQLEIRAVHNLSEKYLNKGPVIVKHSEVDILAMAGEAVAIKDISTDPRILYPKEMVEEGLSSTLCVGLRLSDEPIGVIRAYSERPRDFTQYDIYLLEALANYAAIAIDYARRFSDSLEVKRFEHEFKLAAEIQKRIIPARLPNPPGYDMAARNIPHRRIGGDFYDFWKMADDHIGMVIADGSGKSIPGALLMAMAHAALRVQAQYAFRTYDIIKRTNNFMCAQTEVKHFVSIFYAALNVSTRTLTYTNAGHNPPLIVNNNSVKYLEPGGMVIGVEPDTPYVERQIVLEPGDVLVMTTDGLTEAFSPEDELFGYERVIAEVRKNIDKPANEILDAVCRACLNFANSSATDDDLTLCIVKVL